MKKQHYYLVSGVVIFREPGEEVNAVGEIKLNTTLRIEQQNVPASQIGRAQQSLQMLMFQKLQDTTLEVVDVHITAVSYLGHMTEEFFMKPPEGTVLQEKPATGGTPTPIDPKLN